MADAKNAKPSDESKVFDVAKPEEAKLNTGAKPMVIGHKTLASDPSIREVDTEKTEQGTPEETVRQASSKKITISPSTGDVTKEEAAEVKPPEPQKAPEQATEAAAITPTAKPEETADASPKAEEISKEEGDKKPDSKEAVEEADAERKAAVEELIKSRKYFVNIKERSSFSFFSFIKVAILLLLLAAVLAGALLYSGVITTDVELPFLDNEDPATSQMTEETPAENTQALPLPATTAAQNTTYELTTPGDWVKKSTTLTIEGEPYLKEEYTLPTGAKLVLSPDAGGRGGMCEPDDGDEPHADGNACPTLEILEKTQLTQDVNITSEKLADNAAVYLTKERFTDTDGVSSYSLCLRSFEADAFNPAENEPSMGYFIEGCGPGVTLLSQPSIVVEIIGVDQSSDTFFDNPQVQAIEEVLLTFKLL